MLWGSMTEGSGEQALSNLLALPKNSVGEHDPKS